MRKNIDVVLEGLEDKIRFFESTNQQVSSAAVGWHIEHSLLVIIKICEAVSGSNPDKYQRMFSLKWLLVWITGTIPRGKAKAPPTVIPEAELTIFSLKNSLELARKSILSLKGADFNQYFYHPLFGMMNRESTLVFFAIHTNHHLKIIRDILKSR